MTLDDDCLSRLQGKHGHPEQEAAGASRLQHREQSRGTKVNRRMGRYAGELWSDAQQRANIDGREDADKRDRPDPDTSETSHLAIALALARAETVTDESPASASRGVLMTKG